VNARELQFQRNSEVLRKYIPEPTVPQIAAWIIELDFKLKITKERQSKLGDYTPPHAGLNHTITINHNLNPYAFFITLVHEIAHLTTFQKYRNTVAPHGEEWKREYKVLMQPFLSPDIFPIDVLYALRRYLQNPAAASCSDLTLLRTLKLYDEPDETNRLVLLEHLPPKTHFLYNGSRVFEKGEKLRKRYRCKEISSGAVYLFSPMAEVEVFESRAGA